MANDGEVFSGVFCTYTGLVLIKGQVHDPVKLILNGPVTTRGAECLFRCEVPAGNVESPFFGNLTIREDFSDGVDRDEAA